MKTSNKLLLIGAALIVVGFALALIISLSDINALAWCLLIAGALLGILLGLFQRWVASLHKRGKMNHGIEIFLIVLAVVILIAFKVSLNIAFPTDFLKSTMGIVDAVLVAVGGLLMGHGIYLTCSQNAVKTSD